MKFLQTVDSSGVYYGTLLDETGVLLAGSTLTSLTMTLIDVLTSTTINGRLAQDVKNTNQVALFDTLQTTTLDDGSTVTYNLRWSLLPADNPIVTTRRGRDFELHQATLIGIWSAGTKKITHRVSIEVSR
jgi:hypothetical protein